MKYILHHSRITPGMFTLLLLLTALPAMADWTQRQKVTSIPRGVGAEFGYAVAIDDNTMVVGARHDSTTAASAGAAYVYILIGNTWTQQAVLLANDGGANDEFGYSVAISFDTIVVGAFHDDAPLSNGGSAYVFVRNGTTWTQQQKLTASDGTADDEFGNAVGISFDDIIVGAHHADLPSNSEAGSAYRFNRTGTAWSQAQRLIPTAPVILGDHFGSSVAMSLAKAAIGAAGDDTPLTSAGAVYVFANNGGYFLEQKLTIPNGGNGDVFGTSVAMQGTTLVGGAIGNTSIVGQPSIGAAYAFEFDGTTWQSQGKLTASDGLAFDRFGWSVAVSSGVIAIGARGDATVVGPDAGSAYIFTRSGPTWTQTQKLTPSDAFNGDRFGASAAMTSGKLVIGAAEKALSSPNGQGAAYYFKLQTQAAPFDYDGDGKTDISIFRPANGQWWYLQSSDTSVRGLQFGTATDSPVPADYDGDEKTDIAVFRPSTGEWFILRSSNSTFYGQPFGISTDKPVPGDYDGDLIADIGVFRSSEGTWYVNKSTGGVLIAQWGAAGDIPVNADYDADGKCDTAIFRPANGQWWINQSTAGFIGISFGASTDKPVTADYTGDRKSDIAVFRPSTGTWYVLRSEDSSFFSVQFGVNADIPVAGDYDGDGKADVGVFRSNGGNWFIQQSTQGIIIVNFGISGDLPTPASLIP